MATLQLSGYYHHQYCPPYQDDMKQDTEIIISKTNKTTCQAPRNYNEIYFLSGPDTHQNRACNRSFSKLGSLTQTFGLVGFTGKF